MATDPLSDTLTLLNARCILSGGFVSGGAWSLRFPKPDRIKISAVAKGRCWLVLDGMEPISLGAGDVVLLNGMHPFVLASDLSVEPVDAVTVFSDRRGGTARHGEGDDFFYLGGHIALEADGGDLLRDVLPPVIHIRATADEATVLRWLLDQLMREMATERPGSGLASNQLAQLMFVQALRAYVEAGEAMEAGWLRAIADGRIAPALRLMHNDPGRAWTLGELAKAAGMSRTTFALRFRQAAGVAPLGYLLGWRMHLARRALREGKMPVSALALSLGYTSESAFSNAFKRAVGTAPKRYRSSVMASDDAALDEEADDIDRQAMTGSATRLALKVAS
jgi:AraC-like DNA-binding protein